MKSDIFFYKTIYLFNGDKNLRTEVVIGGCACAVEPPTGLPASLARVYRGTVGILPGPTTCDTSSRVVMLQCANSVLAVLA